MPGNASAAAISVTDRSRSLRSRSVTLLPQARNATRSPRQATRRANVSSIATTPAATDGAASRRTLLALVDVLRRFGLERIVVESHGRPRQIALLPGLRRIERRARGHRERHAQI